MVPNVDLDASDGTLLVAGTMWALVSAAAAVWVFSLGDVVTALGLTLLVGAGLLLVGIDLSPDATSP